MKKTKQWRRYRKGFLMVNRMDLMFPQKFIGITLS